MASSSDVGHKMGTTYGISLLCAVISVKDYKYVLHVHWLHGKENPKKASEYPDKHRCLSITN